MALPNNSILVTPGSGETVATQSVSSKEYQVIMEADYEGHIKGSRDGFLCFFTPVTNAANRRVGDLFNASSTTIVRIQGVWVIPTLTTITGVAIQFSGMRTSAVGTGGTVETPRPMDTTESGLDANITARSNASGGATEVYTYWSSYFNNDETNATAGIMAYLNQLPILGDRVVDITLRQNEGLLIKQGSSGTVGLTGALIYFVVE